MRFLIVSHAMHTQEGSDIYSYGPYVKEMNLWLKHVEKVRVIAPINRSKKPDKIDLAYKHSSLEFISVPAFNVLTISAKLFTFVKLPFVFFQIVRGMIWADHIHLRCPGNMGLLGAVAQIFFPWKIKTVKYAGNWDPDSSQPASYNLQKSLVSNTFLSKNISVLVYGRWPNQTKNIVEFFTATYHEKEKLDLQPRTFKNGIRLVFVGALSPGKRPMIAAESVRQMKEMGVQVNLDLMGEGPERLQLEAFIRQHDLDDVITLHGNQNAEFVKNKMREAHFLILMSKSEGWPKVVAEAMFWGAVPITSNVSCVNYMIGEGSRGRLVAPNADAVVQALTEYINDEKKYYTTSVKAMEWSRQYTLEYFEKEIKKLLHG